ncbi:Nop14-like protein [Coniochaeta ligniaria NRRL 30616]|uniref:Nop14-like protein n=1 Tax=Coniochaeta ligniaria NRRL 30616 TaxID=1408157 RepID=A0A1J7J450_9PEZI|nr:Nop14-like protein [Coniochaeta ligniaria NRRL 30616]
MAGSQLKRLKASLRDQGIIGPQQSKKQKRKQAEDLKGRNDKRLQRSAVLENIREQFNPFQFKTNARGPKFDVTTNKPASNKAGFIKGRPGLSKAIGEQQRRETLLVEMERRNKVGGIIDRRFGEDDPNMTPEEKALQRFTLEKQRLHKKRSMFDLEDDDDAGISLTHFGKKLDLDGEPIADDFDEDDLPSGDESDSDAERKRLKRQRWETVAEEAEEKDNEEPERKKTKKEVMEEVIAKSKHHKYERQAAKEEDEELRVELDKDLSDVRNLLFSRWKPGQEDKDPNQKPLIPGLDKSALEKEYDVRLRQMIQDQRAKPAMRTKTEEEIAEKAAEKLKELEEKRLKRMRGEEVSDDEEESEDEKKSKKKGKFAAEDEVMEDEEEDEFGLGAGIKMRPTAAELGFDDEDDFIIDDDLVAGSDAELDVDSDDDMSSIASDDGAVEGGDDDDDDFSKYLAEVDQKEQKDRVIRQANNMSTEKDRDGVPYTFSCPETFDELVATLATIPMAKVPTVIQRIRALYHPKLAASNKEKMAHFSRALIEYIGHISRDDVDYAVVETLVRHVHSLAKTYPIEIANEYRQILIDVSLSEDKSKPFMLDAGLLVHLTAIGTIFPTSDHFHQVVTPAMLVIGRYLGQGVPTSLGHYATGAYLSILALQFQQLSKRYVPELINFCLDTICALAPEKIASNPAFFHMFEPPQGCRIRNCQDKTPRKLNYKDTKCSQHKSDPDVQKLSILQTTLSILKAAAETWSGKSAFTETFQPALPVISHLLSPSCRPHLPQTLVTALTQTSSYLSHALRAAHLSRRNLELHHHKPLAIKTAIPKFEDSFDPDKHYDPDRERAELAKLKAEHKREKKGAMRELRKDARFLARENLQKKKIVDEAYEKKYRRIVAEIQSTEGKESNDYEREKEARKRSNKRRG